MRGAEGILGHWLIACCTWSRLSRQSYNACCCARCRGVSFRSRWTCWRGCAGIYEPLYSLGDYLLSNKILVTSEHVLFLKISVTRLRNKQKIAQLVSFPLRRFFPIEKRQFFNFWYNLARVKRNPIHSSFRQKILNFCIASSSNFRVIYDPQAFWGEILADKSIKNYHWNFSWGILRLSA